MSAAELEFARWVAAGLCWAAMCAAFVIGSGVFDNA